MTTYMTVDIGDALQDGLNRVGTRAGAILVGLLAAAAFAMAIAQNSFVAAFLQWLVQTPEFRDAFTDVPDYSYNDMLMAVEQETPFALIGDAPIAVIGAVIVAIWLLQLLLKVGTIRWFVEKQSGGVEPWLFTRRVVWTLANLIVGGFVYTVAVVIGLILFVAPGIFLAVALYFFKYEVVVEGENAFSALGNSWDLTEGYRIELFGLGAVVVVVGWIILWLVGVVTGFVPELSVIVLAVVGAAITVATIAVASEAYNQLRGIAGPDAVSDETSGPANL